MRPYKLLTLILLIAATFTACRKEPKTFDERLKEIQGNPKLSQEQVIEELAYLCFRIDAVEVSTKGKDVMVDLAFHGWDESRVADIAIDPPGGIASAYQFAQMIKLFTDFDEFLPLAKERGLSTFVATLQTPTYTGSEVDEWVDTYRVRLNSKQIDNFLKSRSMDLEKRIKMAATFWKVELDRFKEFSYEQR